MPVDLYNQKSDASADQLRKRVANLRRNTKNPWKGSNTNLSRSQVGRPDISSPL